MILSTLGAIAIVSAISLIGVITLSLSTKRLKSVSLLLVSLAAGTLIGDTFIHLLPEALEESADPSRIWYGVIGGIILFFILEKIIHWRHCHLPTASDHPHPLGTMNFIGDGLHNFFDGMLIAGAFAVDSTLGIATTIAVIFHEIPQEIGDFGIMIHAGYSKGKALFLNFASSLFAFAGAAIVMIWATVSEQAGEWLIPVTAGGFLYIAVSDLIPELKKENGTIASLSQLLLIIVGLAIMYGLKFIAE